MISNTDLHKINCIIDNCYNFSESRYMYILFYGVHVDCLCINFPFDSTVLCLVKLVIADATCPQNIFTFLRAEVEPFGRV